jgi:glycosyltransferase involved in cell wall biosynthesis
MTIPDSNAKSTNPRRPKVLLLAYSCMPLRGSEPGIGWNRAKEISKYCDVWVICNEQDCKEPVESYLAEHPDERTANFIYVPRDRVSLALEKFPGLFYLGYRRWHRLAVKAARRLNSKIGFDISHQTTFIGYREPSDLWKLDIPFVWGPIGGTHSFPGQFLGSLPAVARIYELTRNIVNRFQIRTNRRVRQAAEKAARIFVASRHVQSDFKEISNKKTTVLCDVGVTSITELIPKSHNETLKIVWSGVLEARKALDLGLEALARIPGSISLELNVLGEGPMRQHWQQLANRLGIQEKVRFHGNLPHAEAMSVVSESDCFLFSSLRDTTGTVLPEALSLGLPVICLDHQGAADCVDDTCGIKVRVSDRQTTIKDLASALMQFAEDRDRLNKMSRAAHQRARSYLWSKQAEVIASAYNEILAASGTSARCDVHKTTPDISVDKKSEQTSGVSNLLDSVNGPLSPFSQTPLSS